MPRSKIYARIRHARPYAKRILAIGLESGLDSSEIYEMVRLRSVDFSTNEQLTDTIHNYDRMFELGIAVGLLLNRDILERHATAGA